jgi:DNA-binding beta-propeller fold protein YncE
VIELSPRGKLLRSFGRWARGPYPLDPEAVAVDGQNNLYVVDTWYHRIVKLAANGRRLAIWGGYGQTPGQFNHPEGIALDVNGDIYVADTLNARIQKLSPLGKPLAVWGTFGAGRGQFAEPRGIFVDAHGNLFVADTGNDRIQELPGGAASR